MTFPTLSPPPPQQYFLYLIRYLRNIDFKRWSDSGFCVKQYYRNESMPLKGSIQLTRCLSTRDWKPSKNEV